MSVINKKRLREWRRALGAVQTGRVRLWMNLALHITKLRVCKPVWVKRMRACMKCPIYHPLRKTCGHDPEITRIGCGCYMPFKAMSTEATCWARDQNMTMGDKMDRHNRVGWSDDINDIGDMRGSRTCHTASPLYSKK